MPLNPADVATLSRLLDEALALPAVEREAWLAGWPPDRRHLEVPLREMLAHEAVSELATGSLQLPRVDSVDALLTAHTGELVGPYRLIREIGHGGMGTVWLAERADGMLKRQVALKLPRLSWGAGLAERMARERDIGAMLEHPNIARLYDAGVDDKGRPYLALEYIDGQAIDAYCAAQGLDTQARLKLFLPVARAVAYAHGRLVVHRDLKPSNVLVSPGGQVHLLDFGIAKLLDDSAPQAGLTQQQGRVMTPLYASPEQVAGEVVTVQSDVYSLGVLLYELLTGRLPFEPRRKTLGAIEDAVLEGDAPLASSKAIQPNIARALRGDIDAILTKALRREPGRRYATADAMAQDVERHLHGELVSARPDATLYRVRKAVRRHWVGVAATTAVLAVTLIGGGVAMVQAQRALRSAERERAVRDFVAEVLRVGAEPSGDGTLRSAPADAFLERSARLVQSRFADQPALQADLYALVGGTFAEMGASHLAGEYALRRLEALNNARADDYERARARLQLAGALLDRRRFEDAEQQAVLAASLAGENTELKLQSRLVVARSLAARDQLDRLKLLPPDIDAEVARVEPSAGGAAAWAGGLHAIVHLAENKRADAVALLRESISRAVLAEGTDSPVAIELRLIAAKSLAVNRQEVVS